MKATVYPKPVPAIDRVVLEMTYDEAVTLLVISGKVAGDILYSRRKHTSDLRDTLLGVGVTTLGKNKATGSISFHKEGEGDPHHSEEWYATVDRDYDYQRNFK